MNLVVLCIWTAICGSELAYYQFFTVNNEYLNLVDYILSNMEFHLLNLTLFIFSIILLISKSIIKTLRGGFKNEI